MDTGMKKKIILTVILCIFIAGGTACGEFPAEQAKIEELAADEAGSKAIVIREDGNSICERFGVPEGFSRIPVDEGSFEFYLRNLPLRPHGSKVHTYDGRVKFNSSAYVAVVDMDIGDRDLQQCADAVMRLRGEYQYSMGRQDEISFKLTNGFEVPFAKWRDGFRVKVSGNETSWEKRAEADGSYETFRKYMEFVFIYAGTLSIERDLGPVAFVEMKIGDVLVNGGSPGHAVIVVDMAENPDTGEKVFMLAQSYMPAQDIHVLSNPNNAAISPWYSMDFEEELRTPEWTFEKGDLERF